MVSVSILPPCAKATTRGSTSRSPRPKVRMWRCSSAGRGCQLTWSGLLALIGAGVALERKRRRIGDVHVVTCKEHVQTFLDG